MNVMVPIENIVGIIYQFRGQKVILDRDLAELYDVETKVLKQAVRRNVFRFPEDFMFELTLDEDRRLRSQNVTLKQGQHSKYGAMAFTEQGVAMLSSVLKSERAIQVNIQIIRAFTKLRHLILGNDELRQEIESLRAETEGKFILVFQALEVFQEALKSCWFWADWWSVRLCCYWRRCHIISSISQLNSWPSQNRTSGFPIHPAPRLVIQ